MAEVHLVHTPDHRDVRWVKDVSTAAALVQGRSAPPRVHLVWNVVDVPPGQTPDSLTNTIRAIAERASPLGFVLSTVFTDGLRRRKGLRSPLPVPVLDIRHVLTDESRMRDTDDLPLGLRVDVHDERLAGTPWRRVRMPSSLSSEDQKSLSNALAEWLYVLEERSADSSRPSSDLTSIATQEAVLACEVALYQLSRVIENADHHLTYEDFEELIRLIDLVTGQIRSMRPRRAILSPALATARAVLGVVATAGTADWAATDGSGYVVDAVEAIEAALRQLG